MVGFHSVVVHNLEWDGDMVPLLARRVEPQTWRSPCPRYHKHQGTMDAYCDSESTGTHTHTHHTHPHTQEPVIPTAQSEREAHLPWTEGGVT